MSAIAIDNAYRYVATADLLTEWDCWRYALAEIDALMGEWEHAAESRGFVVMRLTDLRTELQRRKRLEEKPHAPAWPTRDPEAKKRELEEIKYRLELGRYVEEVAGAVLVPRGRTLWSPCPLPGHEEHTASFHVDPDKQVWHCFGCGRGGDLFEFARQLYSIGEFWRVVEMLREQAGMERELPPVAAKALRGGLSIRRPDGSVVPLRARTSA